MAVVSLAMPTKLWDSAGRECARTLLYLHIFYIVPPLGAFKSQLRGHIVYRSRFISSTPPVILNIYIYVYIYNLSIYWFIFIVSICFVGVFCTSDTIHFTIRYDIQPCLGQRKWLVEGGTIWPKWHDLFTWDFSPDPKMIKCYLHLDVHPIWRWYCPTPTCLILLIIFANDTHFATWMISFTSPVHSYGFGTSSSQYFPFCGGSWPLCQLPCPASEESLSIHDRPETAAGPHARLLMTGSDLSQLNRLEPSCLRW